MTRPDSFARVLTYNVCSKFEHRLSAMVSALLILSILLVSMPVYHQSNFAWAQEPLAYAVDSSPYGISFKEWTEKWWQWYLAIPKGESHNFIIPEAGQPISAEPVACQALQMDYGNNASSPVFFLPYVSEEKPKLRPEVTDATCTVPAGKAVMVGIDNGIMDYGDPDVNPKTPATLLKKVKETNIYPEEFNIRLDGKPIDLNNQDKFRVQSDPFYITLPEDDIWDYPNEGNRTYLAVADGWYLMLKPLPPGEHELAYTTGYKPPNAAPYRQDVVYHINVVSNYTGP